jgi:hypothetical protein
MEIKCKNCGEVFVMSKEELAWYHERGFDFPKRCPECRKLRRRKKAGDKHDSTEV